MIKWIRVPPRFPREVFSAGALSSPRPCSPTAPLPSRPPTAQALADLAARVYLGIEPNGDVMIVAHRSEMGTGCRTGLPMIVADELEADWYARPGRTGSGRC